MVINPSKFCCFLRASEKLIERYCFAPFFTSIFTILKLFLPGITISFSPLDSAFIGFPFQETFNLLSFSKRCILSILNSKMVPFSKDSFQTIFFEVSFCEAFMSFFAFSKEIISADFKIPSTY